MKVLHLVNTISAGGAELHLLTLCKGLQRQGVEVIVGCLREKVKGSRSLRPDFETEKIRVLHLQADSRYDWRFLYRVVRLLHEERPDILHTHLPRADFAGLIGRLGHSSVPWVCSIHGMYHSHWSGKWTLPLFDRLWGRADAIIAISHAVKDWLMRERHIPSNKVIVIHYGLEANWFGRPGVDLRKALGADGQVTIGSIGRLEPVKGYETLIGSMPAIVKSVPHAFLLIAGHDPWGYGKGLQDRIDSLSLKEQVRLVGFQDDVPSFLQALDVFALASHSEGFGQVLIEAMAAAKPVVVSRIPPLTEIVVHGETGLLVEPNSPQAFAEAISWLVSHPEESRHMGERGQQRVWQHFSAQAMTEKTLSLYRTLIEGAR